MDAVVSDLGRVRLANDEQLRAKLSGMMDGPENVLIKCAIELAVGKAQDEWQQRAATVRVRQGPVTAARGARVVALHRRHHRHAARVEPNTSRASHADHV